MSKIALLLFVLGLCFPTMAQEAAAPAKLRVVGKATEPFAFEDKNGISGYSVDLWRRVAREAGVEFDLRLVKTVPEVLSAIEHGEADVGVGALSITEDREKVLDFTVPFFDESGLQIVAHARNAGSPFTAFASLFHLGTLKVVGIMLIILTVVSHLLWLGERRRNPESFPQPYPQGFWEALWWCVSTMLTGGCENLAPRAFAGRAIGAVWMIGGIALTSYVTATLAAAMTVSTLDSDVRSLADLKGQPVATVSGSSAAVYLQDLKYDTKGFENVDAAMEALIKGDVKAVVYDSPILRYYLSKHTGTDLHVVGSIFEKQAYGFALPLGSPLRKRLNRALLKPEVQDYREELNKRWFAAEKGKDG